MEKGYFRRVLKNASFTDYVPISHITEPDEGRIYRGINSVELEGDTFTLTAPAGWNITECAIENNTRYDINQDNAFDIRDLIRLKKKIAGIKPPAFLFCNFCAVYDEA